MIYHRSKLKTYSKIASNKLMIECWSLVLLVTKIKKPEPAPLLITTLGLTAMARRTSRAMKILESIKTVTSSWTMMKIVM